MIDKFGLTLITLFSIGKIKYAPGTVASAVTCMFYYSLRLTEFKYLINLLWYFNDNNFHFISFVNNLP